MTISGPRLGSRRVRANSRCSRPVSAIPMRMHSIQPGKKRAGDVDEWIEPHVVDPRAVPTPSRHERDGSPVDLWRLARRLHRMRRATVAPVSGGARRAQRGSIAASRPSACQPAGGVASDRDYSLVELVDLAQRTNPQTRQSWERRAQRRRDWGRPRRSICRRCRWWSRRRAPAGLSVAGGTFAAIGPYLRAQARAGVGALDLSRFAHVDEARARVMEASFLFGRRHQEVMFAVARAYYALDASRARLEAAQATLRSATVVEEAAQARLEVGLATRPELLLAREARARAAFDVEAATGAVRAREGALAESVGVAPFAAAAHRAAGGAAVARAAGALRRADPRRRCCVQRPDLEGASRGRRRSARRRAPRARRLRAAALARAAASTTSCGATRPRRGARAFFRPSRNSTRSYTSIGALFEGFARLTTCARPRPNGRRARRRWRRARWRAARSVDRLLRRQDRGAQARVRRRAPRRGRGSLRRHARDLSPGPRHAHRSVDRRARSRRRCAAPPSRAAPASHGRRRAHARRRWHSRRRTLNRRDARTPTDLINKEIRRSGGQISLGRKKPEDLLAASQSRIL